MLDKSKNMTSKKDVYRENCKLCILKLFIRLDIHFKLFTDEIIA